jgi:alpha-mannosidase
VPPDTSALEITPGDLELSAWKPAEDGAGSVLRLLNPTHTSIRAQILLGRTLTESLAAVEAVRLDEHPALECEVHWQADRIEIDVPAHALRSLRLRTRARDSQA